MRSHYLVTAAEMANAGFATGAQFDQIGWQYSAAPSSPATGNLKIYLQNTADTGNTKSTDWTTAISTMTLASDDPAATLPGVAGRFNLPIKSPSAFTYSGGAMYIAFEFSWAGPVVGTAGASLCNTSLSSGLKGAQTTTALPSTLAASNFRPVTFLRSASQPPNDVAVVAVMIPGEVASRSGPSASFVARVQNVGSAPKANVPVTLEVSGAVSETRTVTIPLLASCEAQTVTFDGLPASCGSGLITVRCSVPDDDNNTNNSRTRNLNLTDRSSSYAYPGEALGGYVGFTSSTGEMVARFYSPKPNAVQEVNLAFNTAGLPYRVVVYGTTGNGTPTGSALYRDASDRTSVAGAVNIVLPSSVSVGPGFYHVGIEQSQNSSIGLGYVAEIPSLPETFRFRFP
ncbi:MAG: CARDB domain-containing protein, partial [Verrucomicrobiota bacterium]